MHNTTYLMINLISIDNILSANKGILSDSDARAALRLEGLKDAEVDVIRALCACLKRSENSHGLGQNFHLNYKIPQIGKEFDLLKVDDERVINIELKSSIDEANILKQLHQNSYYLRFTQKEIHCFTFTLTEDGFTLYRYCDADKSISNVDIDELIDVLAELNSDEAIELDQIFDPTNYMISPFNDVSQFINDEYFLTEHQEKIKKQILSRIQDSSPATKNSISGKAGTGKTLLTYDIAKELIKLGWKVLIIHCASFNDGIRTLNQIDGWNVKSSRSLDSIAQVGLDADVIILDESQRITTNQLQILLKMECDHLIFAHDVNQKLNKRNQAQLVVNTITEACGNVYNLSSKIRHNKNLASFIQKLFNLSRIRSDELKGDDFDCVQLYYTDNLEEAEGYVRHLKNDGWEHVYLSNSLRMPDPLDSVVFSSNTSAHDAIGQEYDNVVVTISEHFFHDDSNRLKFRDEPYYNPIETLFQAVTRTRKRLCLVIINNEPVLINCVRIMRNQPIPRVPDEAL